MDIFTAIGTIQTMYGIIQIIYGLQQTVVKHKKEVWAFAAFIGKIEEKLKLQEAYFQQRRGDQTLPRDVATSLENLWTLLNSSKGLLEELQSYLSITHASKRIKELREEINGIRLDIAFDMHFPAQQPHSSGPLVQYVQQPPFPSYGTHGYLFSQEQLPSVAEISSLQPLQQVQHQQAYYPSSRAPVPTVINVQYNIHHHHHYHM